jgi:hypothetical protein
MYRFSRAIYRELADDIVSDPYEGPMINHERVLRACEAAVERLATDRHYFAHPARTLFKDIRIYFPMTAQLRVLRVIQRYLGLADEFLRRLPQNGFDAYGNPLQCRASTHKGYCRSNQHVGYTFEIESPPLGGALRYRIARGRGWAARNRTATG